MALFCDRAPGEANVRARCFEVAHRTYESQLVQAGEVFGPPRRDDAVLERRIVVTIYSVMIRHVQVRGALLLHGLGSLGDAIFHAQLEKDVFERLEPVLRQQIGGRLLRQQPAGAHHSDLAAKKIKTHFKLQGFPAIKTARRRDEKPRQPFR